VIGLSPAAPEVSKCIQHAATSATFHALATTIDLTNPTRYTPASSLLTPHPCPENSSGHNHTNPHSRSRHCCLPKQHTQYVQTPSCSSCMQHRQEPPPARSQHSQSLPNQHRFPPQTGQTSEQTHQESPLSNRPDASEAESAVPYTHNQPAAFTTATSFVLCTCEIHLTPRHVHVAALALLPTGWYTQHACIARLQLHRCCCCCCCLHACRALP
jgi:hypothetical protein